MIFLFFFFTTLIFLVMGVRVDSFLVSKMTGYRSYEKNVQCLVEWVLFEKKATKESRGKVPKMS